MIAGLFVLPLVPLLIWRTHQGSVREAAVRKGQRERRAWDQHLVEAASARHGFKTGMRFPPLPAKPRSTLDLAVGRGKPAVVMLTKSIRLEQDLAMWKKLLSRTPDTVLLIASEDREGDTAEQVQALNDPRIRFVILPTKYLDGLQIWGGRMVYSLDRAGTVRRGQLLWSGTEPRVLKSLIAAAE